MADLRNALEAARAAPPGSQIRYDFLLQAYPNNQQKLRRAIGSPLGSGARSDRFNAYYNAVVRTLKANFGGHGYGYGFDFRDFHGIVLAEIQLAQEQCWWKRRLADRKAKRLEKVGLQKRKVKQMIGERKRDEAQYEKTYGGEAQK